MVASAFVNQPMEHLSIVEVLLKQVEAKVEAEIIPTVYTSEVGASLVLEKATTQAFGTIIEEEQDALYDVETIHTGNHVSFMSDNILNSSMSPLMTKSPTPTPP